MIKKYLKYLSVIFVFAISFIILLNNFRIKNDSELSYMEKYLRHAQIDHKFNESNFSFVKINFDHKNYYERKSDLEINIAAAISLFLIPCSIVFHDFSAGKYYCAEKFLFHFGFENPTFRPPKFHS